VDTYGVGAGYFATMNMPMVRGIEFDSRSPSDAAIVNEDFATRWFPEVDPLGRVIRLGASGERRVIIGVSPNAAQRGFSYGARPALFLPISQTDYEQSMSVVMRTSSSPGPLVRRVADTLQEVDSRLAPESLMTMEERLQLPRWPMRAGSVFFGTCGVLALLLATSGLAAIMAHAVSRREREFGVRLAIGASARQLLGDVLWAAFRLVGPGMLAGLVIAGLFARGVRIALVGIDIASPWTYAAVALLQASIALMASLAPARRAARLDPLTALRAD
jgi:predicted lysophospholipase L1 biosynthesis ABC-type transport system permease subunit